MNPALAKSVARHSLGWLAAANAVGVLLATLLLWPGLNPPLAPFTYGRWMPLHLDWQLYGWCTLPLIGALFAWFLAPQDDKSAAHARWSLRAWSVVLVLGGLAWLAGSTSGKLFLDWHGWTRSLLPLAMLALWAALAQATQERQAELPRSAVVARGLMLLVLLPAPGLLYWSAGREVYPSVNPDSGGATGAALLGSTLALVALGGLLPQFLGLAAKPGNRRSTRAYWLAFGVALLVFAAVDHGSVSHHDRNQILALGTLLAWAPLTWWYFRSFTWPDAAQRWLGAAAVWWSLLLLTGWLTFLPEFSEQMKFTNFLVAHAHLAMAGLVTSLHAAILCVLLPAGFGGRASFWTWQLGCVAHVLFLTALGLVETNSPEIFFLGSSTVTHLLAGRLIAGLAMFGASLVWWKRTLTT